MCAARSIATDLAVDINRFDEREIREVRSATKRIIE
jgi:hypothetical protein